jgi:DNA-directed RNA polymerase subunit beta
MVISKRLVKDDELTSVHIEQYEIEVADTKLGAEETTNDIP